MASIFTFDTDPRRVSSPWSTPGNSTPLGREGDDQHRGSLPRSYSHFSTPPMMLEEVGLTKLEPEPQEGSTEYKLHLLLRPRRAFSSTSTSAVISGSQHSKPFLTPARSHLNIDSSAGRQVYAPSNQTRQTRLQQLTTQLLWRLQQSSPFHSSSTADLVLPLLPEADPKLGVPNRPAKLLPGLEESQGALYEIGVSDDGALVGLIEEELEESLTNLKAMAASLGCMVEVLRKVVIGSCEWTDPDPATESVTTHQEQLWVAEALVRPDLENSSRSKARPNEAKELMHKHEADTVIDNLEVSTSTIEQLRVTLTGCTGAGKSSLLGTLSTSTFDNGRGKSRLSLLKHRHEITSGVTSSVAQELIGYNVSAHSGKSIFANVVNYASNDVSSWNDMHSLSERLIFLSDSPGLLRYAKSAFRTLISWNPHWTVVCISADCGMDNAVKSGGKSSPDQFSQGLASPKIASDESNAALSHLEMCMELQLPTIVVMTKLDLATKAGLRNGLGKVLSALKAVGRRPLLLSTSLLPVPSEIGDSVKSSFLQNITEADEADAQRTVRSMIEEPGTVVPILFTSAVTGAGIGRLHALLRILPVSIQTQTDSTHNQHRQSSSEDDALANAVFCIDEVFSIPPSKVYSTQHTHSSRQGVVLCGYMASGLVSVGDELLLGPFSQRQSVGGRRSSSVPSRPKQESVSNPHESKFGAADKDKQDDEVVNGLHLKDKNSPRNNQYTYTSVRVVSLRNLRLPVRSLLPGQVGTIGVELTATLDSTASLLRTRKGMILTAANPRPKAYRSFTASFPSSHFTSPTSPPLILGGHALAYVHSTRAAVKVAAVLLDECDKFEAPTDNNVFIFDSDDESLIRAQTTSTQRELTISTKQISITFSFINSVEYLQIGDRILIVPTACAAGPLAGASPSANGLTGFVGVVQEAA